MSKGRKRQGDPFADIREWQDHRLDPGHFTGGRIHPGLKGRWPRRFGYVFLLAGMFAIFMLGGLVKSGETWMILGTAFGGILNIGIGLALIRKRAAEKGRRAAGHD